jgi:CTP-dependent riboflavin kinase
MTREDLIDALIVEMTDERKAKLKKWGKRAAGAAAAVGGLAVADRVYSGTAHGKRTIKRLNNYTNALRAKRGAAPR